MKKLSRKELKKLDESLEMERSLIGSIYLTVAKLVSAELGESVKSWTESHWNEYKHFIELSESETVMDIWKATVGFFTNYNSPLIIPDSLRVGLFTDRDGVFTPQVTLFDVGNMIPFPVGDRYLTSGVITKFIETLNGNYEDDTRFEVEELEI